MTNNNTVNNIPTLTAKEIFDQIVTIQNSLGSLSHLTEAVTAIYEGANVHGDEEDEREDVEEFKSNSVECLVDAFKSREETYWKMLKLYEMMYDDFVNQRICEDATVHQKTKKLMLGVLENENLSDEGKQETISSLLPYNAEDRDFCEEAIARIFDNVGEDDQLAAIRVILSNN